MNRHAPLQIALRIALFTAGLFVMAGCYERVVSERPFAGMASSRGAATAPDYSGAQAAFEERYREQTEPKFDPFGDFGRWVGGIFSSDEPKPTRGSGSPAATAGPSTTPTEPPPAPAPTSPSGGSRPSPFDTTP